MHGQKTGFYLDQVPNYPAVAEHARDRRVLDCFTGQGGFALACAQAGAAEVTGVEGSGESLAIARANAQRNGRGYQLDRAGRISISARRPRKRRANTT